MVGANIAEIVFQWEKKGFHTNYTDVIIYLKYTTTAELNQEQTGICSELDYAPFWS